MPFKHVIDHQRGYMETEVPGPVTWSELQAHWAAELADGGETYPELIDGTRATVEFSSEELRRLVTMLQGVAQSRRLGPSAIVTTSDIGFGMIRMLGSLVEPFCEIRPFRDRAFAQQWLSTFMTPPR